ncbi:hypothetical protein B0H19DRAFT_964622, partial [Mycena capillaripes]
PKAGGFKMSSFGRSSQPLLGENGSVDICAKRTYYEKATDGMTYYYPHPSPRQGQDLMSEIACNVWSACLLDDVYRGIDKFISTAPTPPPFEIPRLRFVRVAFASEGKQTTKDYARSGMVFLLEELIDEKEQGPFRKYINNRAAIPTSFQDEENRHRAGFLAFTQHWQFKVTHGLAFVSDYQGSLLLFSC